VATPSEVTASSAPALRCTVPCAGCGPHQLRTKPAVPGHGPKVAQALILFYLLSQSFSDLNIHRNSITLLKYIENGLKLRKIQNKFCWNPLRWILEIDLTQLHFVHYCLLENFYESIIGVFNYKNL
jgi:hypothetical protein